MKLPCLRRFPGVVLTAVCLWLAAPSAVSAADAPADKKGDPRASAPAIPPELLSFEAAAYPAEALEKGVVGTVLLQIDIGADGSVTAVKVKEPAGYGFDEAATAAAWKLIFKPAVVGGKAAASRILFPYRFELKVPETKPASRPATDGDGDGDGDGDSEPETTPALPPNMTGRVLVRGERAPISGAEVLLPDLGVSAVTDGEGRFSLRVPPGSYKILVAAPDFVRIEDDLEILEGKAFDIKYYLSAAGSAWKTTVRDKRTVRDVAVRDISAEEIKRIPGALGDAFKVVQVFPGVARAPADLGLIVVRGSDPEDTRYFFMGHPINYLFHFAGLRAIVNADMFEQLNLLPGGFGVRYGRAMGGIIEAEPRRADYERYHGYLDINVFDAGVFVEGPIPVTKDLGFMAGFRRSWIDLFLGLIIPSDGAAFTVAPRYWDYQLAITWNPTPKDDIRAMVFSSVDTVSLLINDAELPDTGIRGDISSKSELHRGIVRWKRRLTDNVFNELSVSVGATVLDFAVGVDLFFNLRFIDVAVRDEIVLKMNDRLDLALGLDLQFADTKIGFRIPGGTFESDEIPEPFSERPPVTLSRRLFFYDTAAYFELRWRPFDSLLLVPGFRVDYFWLGKEATVDPRVNVRWTTPWDRLTLKASFGVFHQPPTGADVAEPFGSPAAGPEFALQTVAGFELKFTDYLDLDIQGFWKDMNRLLVNPTAEALALSGSPDINTGIGTVIGMEVLLRHRPHKNLFFWVSYTLSRATRKDRPGEETYLFDFDQTHILSAVINYKLPFGFEIGARWRYVTGGLETPIAGGIYDADADYCLPIPGELNSVRNKGFHQLDIRVDKKFTFKTWYLAFYVDVQNAYNRKNPEATLYDSCFEESAPINGLPIIPALGIKGGF